jgi:hypothetical protein
MQRGEIIESSSERRDLNPRPPEPHFLFVRTPGGPTPNSERVRHFFDLFERPESIYFSDWLAIWLAPSTAELNSSLHRSAVKRDLEVRIREQQCPQDVERIKDNRKRGTRQGKSSP